MSNPRNPNESIEEKRARLESSGWVSLEGLEGIARWLGATDEEIEIVRKKLEAEDKAREQAII